MKRKFLFIINPISGHGRNRRNLRIMEDFMRQKGFDFDVMDSEPDGSYKHLPVKIAQEGITDVVVCGGDGTVNQVASHVLGLDIPIGIIPMGSGNGLAFTAGIPKDIRKALQVLVTAKPVRIDAFWINERFACMLCGLGFDAQVAHDFARQTTRGLATYVKETLKNFIRAKAYPFEVETGTRRFQTKAFFISVANSNQFGNQVTIAPKASLQDGLLDVVIVQETAKWNMLYSLIRQLKWGRLEDPLQPHNARIPIHYFQTDCLRILNPQQAPLHIDGEAVFTDEILDIRVIPGAIHLLRL